jgi:hypothetical protein
MRAAIVLGGVLVVIACATIATHRTDSGTDKRTWYWIGQDARTWTDKPTWYWTAPETGEQVKILASRPIYIPIFPISTPDHFMLIGQDDHLSPRPGLQPSDNCDRSIGIPIDPDMRIRISAHFMSWPSRSRQNVALPGSGLEGPLRQVGRRARRTKRFGRPGVTLRR